MGEERQKAAVRLIAVRNGPALLLFDAGRLGNRRARASALPAPTPSLAKTRLVPIHKRLFLLVEVGRIGAEGGRARGHSTAFLVGAGLLSLGERKSSMGDRIRRSAGLGTPRRTDRVRSV